MSMSKSNSKGKCLGPLFLNRGDGGLKTFEVEIQSGSYLKAVGGPVGHKQIQPEDVCSFCIDLWEFKGLTMF